jgi:hypothetical protein
VIGFSRQGLMTYLPRLASNHDTQQAWATSAQLVNFNRVQHSGTLWDYVLCT